MLEYFYFEEKRQKYIALVFEKLGKSLYYFIKENDYKGFCIEHIQGMTKQILEGMAFIHERLKIVHTDLKVKKAFQDLSFVLRIFKLFKQSCQIINKA
jgi:serine/threonine protein kinase